MTPWLDDGDVRLYHGDCLEVLALLPERSMDCCVTSPPYWGLRDYGTGRWEGGDSDCDHTRHNARAPHERRSSTLGGGTDTIRIQEEANVYRDVCGKCGATRVDRQLGLEQTPQEYVARMVEVFRAVRQVLKDDGTVWLNLGDSYNANGRDGHGTRIGAKQGTNRASAEGQDTHRPTAPDLKPKDLVGIPWRVAFALQDDGWYLRSDIIWAKPNPMPESVTDRPTKAHEYVFLLSKQPQYFWDQEAIRETYTPDGRKTTTVRSGNGAIGLRGASDRERWAHSGRNVRSVWEIATQPFPGAHFAVFPMELARRCVLAGSPLGGTVLDPFSGSGTTALVARNHQRHAIGIELNEDYLRIAADRLAQQSLLTGEAA